jgi:hypothetical protein
MPILLRAAPVSDLVAGDCRSTRVRGERMWVCNVDGVVLAFGTECCHFPGKSGTEACRHFRVEVRGGLAYVAIDPDPADAPADVHQNDRTPAPVVPPPCPPSP